MLKATCGRGFSGLVSCRCVIGLVCRRWCHLCGWMFVSLLLTVHAVRGRASSGWSNSVMYDAVTSTVVTVPAAPEGLWVRLVSVRWY